MCLVLTRLSRISIGPDILAVEKRLSNEYQIREYRTPLFKTIERGKQCKNNSWQNACSFDVKYACLRARVCE